MPNAALLDVGLELVGEGFALHAVLDVVAAIVEAMEGVAELCVAFVNDNLWAGFVDAGMPAEEAERMSGILQRMRPRAQAAVDAALNEAMQREVDAVFTETATRLASKSRRRKPSAS